LTVGNLEVDKTTYVCMYVHTYVHMYIHMYVVPNISSVGIGDITIPGRQRRVFELVLGANSSLGSG
jgi:hypothetical protein